MLEEDHEFWGRDPIWWESKGSINIMPSKIMEQRHLSSSHMSNGASSFFSEEIRFPSERQVGLRKAESVPNHCGNSGSKTVSSSSLEKFHPMSGNQLECLEFPQAYVFKDQKSKISNERHLMGVENSSSLSVTSWKTPNQYFQSGSYVQPGYHFVEEKKVGLNELHYEGGFFSSSLSDMFNRKISLSSNNVPLVHSVDTTLYNFREDKPPESSEDIEAQTIRNLLPDDDDLLSGIMDDVEYVVRPNFGDDTEDDLFYSGGGMELESADATFISNKPSEFVDEGASNGQPRGLSSSFDTEHSHGEHPSRTLFVGNINSNVEESELRDLFEQYGDMCALYTACKHRGFVMISYFDIRAAKNAMRDLQNKRFRHWKLDIHFYVSKENPYDNDTNKGTLVVFDLGSSVSNEDLLQIFGVHGDIKEIRETQHDHQKKYVEFYDVRAAEAALHALDKCDIGGKRIKLELSYPGDAKKCLMWHLSPGLDQEERRPGNPLNNLSSESLNSAIQAPLGSTFHGASTRVPYNLSSLMRAATVGNHSSCLRDFSNTLGHINHLGYQCTTPTFHPHSLPDYQSRVNNDIHFNSPSSISAMDIINSDGMNSRQIHRRVSSSVLNSHSFEHREAAFGVVENGTFPLHAQQYLWNGSETYHHQHHPPGAMMWHSSPSFVTSIPPHPLPQMHGLPRAPSHLQNTVLPSHQHHVGSAPSESPSLWDRRHAYAGDSVEVSAFHGGSLGNIEFTTNNFPRPGGNFIEPSISPLGTQGRNVMPASYDHPPNDRVRSRRSVASANQLDNKKQYELDIDRIMRGKDSKTTLMIKNIPNKYTSKMLLATIDENHRGTYDFIYLPIDFKNKCNVGYAFINMIDPQHIIPIFQAFNGKKWEKFNSEKVASLAYARIQGKQALIAHFQNSSLMNEDKRCRPIIFHTDGPNAGDQEPFPMGVNTRFRPSRSRTASGEANGNGSDSSSGSSKD